MTIEKKTQGYGTPQETAEMLRELADWVERVVLPGVAVKGKCCITFRSLAEEPAAQRREGGGDG